MQLMASPGVTCEASSKMTTSKFMSGGRYWLTASGDIMKTGLMAREVLLVRPIRSRTGMWRGVFFPSRGVTPGSPVVVRAGLPVVAGRVVSLGGGAVGFGAGVRG